MGGPRLKPVLKDARGVIHHKIPESRSVFSWCSLHLRLRPVSQRQYRLVKWVDPDEVVNCVRCILISLSPGDTSDFFL